MENGSRRIISIVCPDTFVSTARCWDTIQCVLTAAVQLSHSTSRGVDVDGSDVRAACTPLVVPNTLGCMNVRTTSGRRIIPPDGTGDRNSDGRSHHGRNDNSEEGEDEDGGDAEHSVDRFGCGGVLRKDEG